MLYSELNKFVTVVEAKDYGSVGIDGDSIHMGRLHHVALHFNFGAITGNSILKFYQGATAGAKTTALAFAYRTSSGDYKATDADTLGALTAVASTGLTLTAATYDHRVVVVEFDGVDLANGFPWLTSEIDSTATVMLVGCTAIARPRFVGNASPTLI